MPDAPQTARFLLSDGAVWCFLQATSFAFDRSKTRNAPDYDSAKIYWSQISRLADAFCFTPKVW